MKLLALLIAPLALAAQVSFTFSPPQPSRIPGLQEFRAVVTNFSDTPQQVYGLSVYDAAHAAGISWLADVGVNEWVKQLKGRWGFWRIAGIACEVGGYGGSVIITGKLADIKERLAAIFPAAAAGCSIGRMIYNREHVDVSIPRDLLPPLITIPAHTRQDFAIYGR